jgi:hypothetical protein
MQGWRSCEGGIWLTSRSSLKTVPTRPKHEIPKLGSAKLDMSRLVDIHQGEGRLVINVLSLQNEQEFGWG